MGGQGPGDGTCRGHQSDLPDALGAEGTLGLGVLDQNDLDRRHVLGAKHTEVANSTPESSSDEKTSWAQRTMADAAA